MQISVLAGVWGNHMRLLTAFLAIVFLAAPAASQNLKSSTPQGIAERIRSLGYKADLQTDDSGDPVIISATDGSQFQLVFYGCQKGKNCEWIMFYKGYTLEKDDYVKVRQIADEWNLDINFSKAAMGDDAVHLTFHLLMNNEGLGPKIFDSNFATWLEEYVEFRKKIVEAVK